MIEFNFTTDGIADIEDRQRECNNFARIVDTLGKGTSIVVINRVSINADFHGASMDAKLSNDGGMTLEIVFANGTSVDTKIELNDRITIDSVEGFLFINIYA